MAQLKSKLVSLPFLSNNYRAETEEEEKDILKLETKMLNTLNPSYRKNKGFTEKSIGFPLKNPVVVLFNKNSSDLHSEDIKLSYFS